MAAFLLFAARSTMAFHHDLSDNEISNEIREAATMRRPRCLHCGKYFTAARRGRPPKYCCAAHRQAAFVSSPQRLARIYAKQYEALTAVAEIRRAALDALAAAGVVPAAPRLKKSRA
jgi:hypothetical protein